MTCALMANREVRAARRPKKSPMHRPPRPTTTTLQPPSSTSVPDTDGRRRNDSKSLYRAWEEMKRQCSRGVREKKRPPSAAPPYHGHGVVQQRLPEHQDVKLLVDVHLLEDREHGHGVDGGYQRAKQQTVEQSNVPQRALGQQAHTVEGQTDAQDIP